MFKYERTEHTHIVLRGAFLTDTVRCTAENPYRPHSYLRYDEYNFIRYAFTFNCYVDVRVGAYILGTGPSTLTVQRFFESYWPGWFARSAAEQGKTEQEVIEDLRRRLEAYYAGAIVGREEVLFLGPADSISAEFWEVFQVWDVQRREDDTVIAVHPDRDLWRILRPNDYQTHISKLEMELPALTQAVTAAHQARVTEYGGRIGADANLPMLLTDANQLRQYYIDVGAYDPSTFPPAQPPQPCGLAVSDQANNPGLMRDCMALLAAKDTLRGSTALNWSVNTAITGWDGVTTGGTPSRVKKLLLPSLSLSGSIPGELGRLSGLTHLDLSNNSLTGEIPSELGDLPNLAEVRLSGNSLTGCIPPVLKDVTTNDLNSLNLLYCPPAPGDLTADTASENSVPLTWTAVANASKYRVESRDAYYRRWTVDDETVTGTAHAVDGLSCWSGYQLRVRAYGDGTTHAGEWSAPSASVVSMTGQCVPPTFGAASYSFSLHGDADVGTVVGSVSATGSVTGDTVTYSITGGEEGGNFAIDESTGEITVAGDLSSFVGTSIVLTVEATDTSGGSATVTATVNVVEPGPPPTYLTEEIPPCTPVTGSSVDPCEPRSGFYMGPDIRAGSTGDFPLLVEDLVSYSVEVFTTHVALRGTYIPGTVRCTSGHPSRAPSYLGRGQASSGLLIYCFADVRVNAYLLGTGPSTLTVTVYRSLYQSAYAFGGDDDDYGLEQLESRRLAYERALSEGGRFQYDPPLRGFLPPDGGLGLLRREYDTLDEAHEPNGPAVIGPPGGIGGREAVLFIGPSGRLSVEAWVVRYTWDVERREDGTVVAIHPYRDRFDLELVTDASRAYHSLLEMELPALTQAVTTAHQARVAANGGRIGEDTDLPMLVTDANRLRQFFSDPKVGGYAPGVPAPRAAAAAVRPRRV